MATVSYEEFMPADGNYSEPVETVAAAFNQFDTSDQLISFLERSNPLARRIETYDGIEMRLLGRLTGSRAGIIYMPGIGGRPTSNNTFMAAAYTHHVLTAGGIVADNGESLPMAITGTVANGKLVFKDDNERFEVIDRNFDRWGRRILLAAKNLYGFEEVALIGGSLGAIVMLNAQGQLFNESMRGLGVHLREYAADAEVRFRDKLLAFKASGDRINDAATVSTGSE